MKISIKSSSQKLLSYLTVLVIGLGLYGCAASTEVIGSWKRPEAVTETYNNVVVAAMTDNIQARQIIEEQLENQLELRGVKATKSIELFPPSAADKQGGDPDMMLQRIQGEGYDGIITAAVVDQETETRYVPGNLGYGAYAPVTRFGWYNTFRGYYGYMSPALYQPGYYTKDKIYFLESNLYDAGSENLVWSAQSRSYDPGTVTSFADEFAEVTVKQLAKDNVIQ
ncbi:hypothetical protein [Pontibacter pamirensis]|uniref:hypothetical protein n=1 Tax=Pontibacter pamirensis TaxID=2562824 RepID=UPI0013898E63|nr:hypothetical protein [Pontibacter pamirensis]